MFDRTLLLIAASSGFFSVALGAFGAHALRTRLDPALFQVFQTGVQYQFFHALALGIAAGLAGPWGRAAGWSFAVGTVVFSGSLYILALSGVRTWGAVTPFGGVAFLIGWALLFWGAAQLPR